MQNHLELLTAYNQSVKQMDDVYRRHARRCGISDTIMWVLYSIVEAAQPMTQSTLCESWFYTPQTVNSALKSMEKEGILEMVPVAGNKKSKELHLTARGEALAEAAVVPMLRAEETAFLGLCDAERAQIVAATQHYAKRLAVEAEKIYNPEEK